MDEAEFVTVGEALIVLIAEPPARLASASAFRSSVAGAESNVAVGLARLGHRASFLGRVGADALGEMVLRLLRSENVDVSHVRAADLPTGVIIRDSASARPTEVAYYRAGSAGASLRPDDIPAEFVRQSRHLHISGITAVLSPSARAAAEHAARTARRAGRPVSFDPNLRRKLCTTERARESFTELLSLATMVLVSEDEAAALSGRAAAASSAQWFLEQGPELVVVKRGPGGAVATDGTRWWACPAHPVTVVDPVGAGDAFAAGFLSRWQEGRDCDAALRAATVTAALAMTGSADIDALPSKADLEAVIAGTLDARR